jgi:hypothetical protein
MGILNNRRCICDKQEQGEARPDRLLPFVCGLRYIAQTVLYCI